MNYEDASGSDKEELTRILITLFFEDSVFRYGPDSEQSRALSKFLVPNGYDSEQKAVERAPPDAHSHPCGATATSDLGLHLLKIAGCGL